MHSSSFAVALAASLTPLAAAHGWVKQWSVGNGFFEQAQNQSLPTTAFRPMAINQGWIGANFLTTGAITCGASDLPDDSPTDAPTGTFYSAANNSAGRTLEVPAGGVVNLLISGPGPGQPWPHNQGNIMAYLGYCGASATACQNFDASTAPYFKILGDQFGIQQTLINNYDAVNTGNHYSVNIPVVQTGSYIFRFEMVTFGQSTDAQGLQDQYYPFCGQIYVSGGFSDPNPYPTVRFPGAYQNGNINFQVVPGPDSIASLNGSLVDPTMAAKAAALLSGTLSPASGSSASTSNSTRTSISASASSSAKSAKTVTVTVTDSAPTVTVTKTVNNNFPGFPTGTHFLKAGTTAAANCATSKKKAALPTHKVHKQAKTHKKHHAKHHTAKKHQ